jgi:diadenosine tetraphosphate (Ap4A) HIT family hydrolase
MANVDCLLCRPADADTAFDRLRVWEDDVWRLSVVQRGPVAGFAHLEPHRHVPYVTELTGDEARTFGGVLAACTRALRDAAGADKTYAYVFGDHIAHFHVNLAPHHPGDALRGGPGLLEPGAPEVPADVHRAVTDDVRLRMQGGRAGG